MLSSSTDQHLEIHIHYHYPHIRDEMGINAIPVNTKSLRLENLYERWMDDILGVHNLHLTKLSKCCLLSMAMQNFVTFILNCKVTNTTATIAADAANVVAAAAVAAEQR